MVLDTHAWFVLASGRLLVAHWKLCEWASVQNNKIFTDARHEQQVEGALVNLGYSFLFQKSIIDYSNDYIPDHQSSMEKHDYP